MNKNWYPNDYVESTYKIDFAELAKEGYSAVIFDVDNTLVPHGAPADDRAKELFQLLNANGFSCMLLSNNKEPRVKSFAEDVKYTSYIYKANKPSNTGYKKAMEQMGSNEDNTILISSHISNDLEHLCDDIYMIDDGKIMLHEDTDVLLSKYALLKVDEKTYKNLDKEYVLKTMKEGFGYTLLTNEKQYYQENYKDIVIENAMIDNIILMMVKGKQYEGTNKKRFRDNHVAEEFLFDHDWSRFMYEFPGSLYNDNVYVLYVWFTGDRNYQL